MDNLEGQGSLPSWLIRIQELDNQRQKDLTLCYQYSVVFLYKYSHEAQQTHANWEIGFLGRHRSVSIAWCRQLAMLDVWREELYDQGTDSFLK